MASGDITAKNYQCTVKHNAGIVVDGDFATGTSCRHLEISAGYVLVAYETPTGIGCRIGVKDGLACVPFSATEDATITGTYTIEDFVALSATQALLIMRETVGNIFTAVVTFTAPATLVISAAVDSTCDAVTTSIRGCLINTSKVIIAYKDTSDSYPKAVVCTITGTVPSYGTPTSAKAAACTNATSINLCKVTTTTFFMTYDNGTNFYGHILTFNGTTGITINTESSFAASLNTRAYSALLDSTHILVCFSDTAVTSYVACVVAVISNTTISSWGSKVQAGTYTQPGGISIISATRFALLFTTSANTITIAIVGSISSGTTITYGTIVSNVAGSWGTNGMVIGSVQYIDATHLSYCLYDTTANRRRVYYQVWTITGVAIAYNNMTVKLCKASGVNIMLSLISWINNSMTEPMLIYLNGNEISNKFLQHYLFGTNAATDTAFSRGWLPIPNSPIVANNGYGIYIGFQGAGNGAIATINACGLEETV